MPWSKESLSLSATASSSTRCSASRPAGPCAATWRGGRGDERARASRFFRTMALDLPSGLSAYEESPAPKDRDAAVIADVTIAVGFTKSVLVREALAGWVGRLEVVPWSSKPENASKYQVLVPGELAGLLPRRSAFRTRAISASSPLSPAAPASPARRCFVLMVRRASARDFSPSSRTLTRRKSWHRKRRRKRWFRAGESSTKRRT